MEIESTSKPDDLNLPISSEKEIETFVGKLYGKRSITLHPKENDRLESSVEFFFKNPEESSGVKTLSPKTFVEIHLKEHSKPLYVKIDTIVKAMGLSAVEKEKLQKGAQKEIAELGEKAEKMLDSSQLEKREKTEAKLSVISQKLGSSDFVKALDTLYTHNKINRDRLLEILHDSDFEDKAMQDTMIEMGKKLDKYGKLEAGYVRSVRGKPLFDENGIQKKDKNGNLLYEKKSYAYHVDEHGEVDIYSRFLGKGSFKKAKISNRLSGGKFAVLTMKGADAKDELERDQTNLQKAQGIMNVPPIHKYSYETKTKGGQAKYVMVQELYSGDGDNLKKLPAKHALNVLTDVGLAYGLLHERSLIHSDIKPANISLKGDLKNDKQALKGVVNDFGLLTEMNQGAGSTPNYESPEYSRAYEKWIDLVNKYDNATKAYDNYKNNIHERGMDANLKELNQKKQKASEEYLKGMEEINKTVTGKFDSFSFGVTIFEIVTGRDSLQNGQFFSSATDDKEIENEILDEFDKWENQIKATTDNAIIEDANIRMEMLAIELDLLKIKPEDRLTCMDAAIALQDLCVKFDVKEQAV